MHIEGIVLSKTTYKERDLICDLLLRSGKKQTVYFYGGRGGGKNNKGSIIEVGFMLAVELGPKKKAVETSISIAKEYKLLWRADLIRNDFQAFYLASFYLEYITKIAVDHHAHEFDHEHHDEGLFNVLSNALFYLNHSLENQSFDLHTHLFIFLAKLSAHLGITPSTDLCVFCDSHLAQENMCLFDHQNGGFVCLDCNSKRDEFLSDNNALLQEYQSGHVLREALRNVVLRPYKEYALINKIARGSVEAKFNFINYQFGFSADQVRSWKLICC